MIMAQGEAQDKAQAPEPVEIGPSWIGSLRSKRLPGFRGLSELPGLLGFRRLSGLPGLPSLSSLYQRHGQSRFEQTQRSIGGRWQKLIQGLLLMVCCLFMTGCVDYQLGVTIDSPHVGQMTQHIQLSNPKNPTAQALLNRIQQQTRSVEGHYQARSPQDVIVTIPFHSAKELESKFNRFFAVSAKQDELPPVLSKLQVTQRNALLFEQDRLVFDLDLSTLGLKGAEGFADPGQLFNLGLTVNGKTWPLKAGQKNHIDTDFWLPMPLGWGTLLIVGLVVGGMAVRHRSATL